MNDANLDYLTGLYTRQGLYDLYESMEVGSHFHLMFMDVDNFKNVNDVYGHNEGDNLLRAVAHILRATAPEAKAIRLGGDEFVLIFEQEYSRDYLCAIADTIIARIKHKEGFSHISTSVSASIGILYDETVGGSLNDTLMKSDKAMYYAKSHGKSRRVVFNDIADLVSSEIKMEKMQQSALANGEIELRYLPIISSQTSKLKLTQVRLYWNMSDGTIKSQEDFLPLFERNGFIRQLDAWVLNNVITHLKRYHEVSHSTTKVGIRISRLLLLENDFAEKMQEMFALSDIAPFEIEFEIDESAFVRGSGEMFATMEKLKRAGFGVGIIGVGSEFRSLAYWDKLNFDSIMFDKLYLKNTLSTSRGKQIVKTLLAMGRQLKMQVMADGITEREDVLYLSGCGCNAIGGAYYSEPLLPEDYFAYIQDKIIHKDEKVVFPFKEDFLSADGRYEGKIRGQNIQFAEGISERWGSILFPGGSYGENVVELPATILSESSYTVCMWIKPLQSVSWVSAFYARYQGCFAAFSPFVIGGTSAFRVSEDADVNGFHDIFVRQLQQDAWGFVCLTYDGASDTNRIYINGRKAGVRVDLPSLSACRQILLGGDPFQPSFEGYMSGLTFYGYVKSEEEIQEMYQQFCKEPGFRGSREKFWLEDGAE